MTRKARLQRLNPLFTIELQFPKLDVARGLASRNAAPVDSCCKILSTTETVGDG